MKTENAVPSSTTAARTPPRGASPDLAVRIPGPGQVQERLKAERVQLALKALPSWRLAPGGRSIDRVRTFPVPHVAAAYAAFAAALADSHQLPIAIALSAGQVVLTLSAPVRKGACGSLTAPVLELAACLG